MVGSSSKTAVALQHTLSCSVRTSSCPFVQAWKHHPCDVCFDPMRRSLRHKNKAPRIDLVSVSAIMDFVGMYSIRTSPLLTLSFMHEEIAMPNMTSTVTRALALSHQLHGGLVSWYSTTGNLIPSINRECPMAGDSPSDIATSSASVEDFLLNFYFVEIPLIGPVPRVLKLRCEFYHPYEPRSLRHYMSWSRCLWSCWQTSGRENTFRSLPWN